MQGGGQPPSQWGDLNNNNGWGNFMPNNPNLNPSQGQNQPNPLAMLGNVFQQNGGMPPQNNNNGHQQQNQYGQGGSNPYGNNPYR
jgi:hypothetical protein